MSRLFISIIIISVMISSCQSKQKVDLLFRNGVIYTINDSMQIVDAVIVHDGIILATGSAEKLLSNYDPIETIDLKGKTVFPGFIDAHCHFYGLGEGLIRWANLRNTRSMKEIIEKLKLFTTQNPQEWILGRGWDQNDWEDKNFPDCQLLDKTFPEKPIALIRIDGHAMLVNSAALRMAGITADTKVEGGEVLLKNGVPTGVLIDNAMQLVKDIIPVFPLSLVPRALQAAESVCFSYGLTTVADAGLDAEIVEIIDSLQQSQQLSISIDAWLNPTKENLDKFISKDVYTSSKLRVGAIKLYADGALGSRGALLKEPYSDDSSTKGLEVDKTDKLHYWAAIAEKYGYQINVHAIGDAAVQNVINVFSEILTEGNDLRWRIEHAQIVGESEMKLFRQFSIVPSVQPTHATSDMYWAGERIGHQRMQHAYAYADLLKQNNWLPLGTDFPIEEVNPVLTFYAAVVRKDLNDFPEGGFQTDNALSREQAIKGMTIWAAKASFMENIAGSIEPGKKADFVVVSADLMKVSEKEIPAIKTLATYVDGNLVYSDQAW